jgi:exodeoxyribonuclease V beta subunit
VNLVEASAGTGKTYAIAALYCRLVAEEGYSVDRILVVTYTEAATEELRGRIRERLREAHGVFGGKETKDPFLRELLANSKDHVRARSALWSALCSFDESAIHTIHGFCLRALSESAFESGSPFDAELMEDVDSATREVVDDLWRRKIFTAAPLFARYVMENATTEQLFSLVGRWGTREGLTVLPAITSTGLPEAEERFKKILAEFGRVWEERREEACRLLGSGCLKGNIYKPDSIPEWGNEIDRFLRGGGAGKPPDKLEKFSTSSIEKALKKGFETPRDPLFDLCRTFLEAAEELENALKGELLRLKAETLREAKEALKKLKGERNLRHFDDLLTDLRDALRGESRERLVASLRSRYRAALIDEFQDTDPIQYEIFKTVFGEGPLFLIGDPKQAIYGFRGADVNAYIAAAKEASRSYTLDVNWRSAPDLIEAVNSLFGSAPRPFGHERIPFHPASPAEKEHKLLAFDGELDRAPFKVWFTRRGEEGKPIGKTWGRRACAEAVAGEIVRLLAGAREGRVTVGGAPLQPGDVAVLVRTNKNALIVKDSLTSRGVPSVICTEESVFESREAWELLQILHAVANPADYRSAKGALATDIMGRDGGLIARMEETSLEWFGLVERLYSYREEWRNRSFVAMARNFLSAEKVRRNLLSCPDGERKLTNLLQCVELLEKADAEEKLGVEGVIKYLSAKIADPSRNPSGEHQLRIETDERAVRIITIHKSKGLEYPVVFCPFLWDSSSRRKETEVACRDAGDPLKVILDLGSPLLEEHREQKRREDFAEEMRLLYVALTRASAGLYLVWGGFSEAHDRAANALFHPSGTTFGGKKDLSDEEMLSDLENLSRRSGGRIAVASLPEPSFEILPRESAAKTGLSLEGFRGAVASEWSVTSFSALSSGRSHVEELPDRDYLGEDAGAKSGGEGGGMDIFAFPKGARAGDFFHSIFEVAGYEGETTPALLDLVTKRLGFYGFATTWSGVVAQTVNRTINAAMGGDGLTLRGLPARDRINELEFLIRLGRVTVKDLARWYENNGGGGLSLQIPPLMEKLEFSPVKGVLRGFIDLVFRQGGRYYLLDWKSNHLGNSPEAYSQEKLERAMASNYYFFQSHLYAAALHLHLRRTLPGYDYDTHFGGTVYAFIRGAGGSPGQGFYRDRPPAKFIEGLAEFLTGGGKA